MVTDMKCNNAEYLVDRFLDEIIRLSLVYVKNIEDAKDIAQQVFVTYLQKKPVFENEEHAKNWLFKVAVNMSKNHRRSRKTTIDFESLENVLYTDDALADEKEEDQQAVFDAVMGLRQSYREVIHLYYYEGFTTEEISRLLGVSPGTVRSKLSRARDAIEKTLKGGKIK